MKTFLRYLMVSLMVLSMTSTSIFAENSNLSGSENEEYSIYVAEIEGCTIVSDRATAQEGDLVTITVTLDEGYGFNGDLIISDYEQDTVFLELNSYYSFIMPAFDVYVEAFPYLLPTPKTLTINYIKYDGTPVHEPYVAQVLPEEPFSVNSPVVEGYTANRTVVSGYMPWNNYTQYVYYMANSYTLTINYLYEVGGNVYPSYSIDLQYGESYYFEPSPLSGYICEPSIVQGTMPAEDVTVNVYFYYDNPYYMLYEGDVTHGYIDMSQYYGYAGDVITLYAYADEGYEFDHWQVTDMNGTELEVFMDQFVMPDSDVIINAIFNEIPSTLVLMHSGTVTTCYSEFYDTGGANGSYSANEDYTITFLPGVEGNLVKISFNTFWIEKNHDKMFIYNGASTSAPLMGTYFDRQLASKEVVASNNDGALTVRFTSDRTVNRYGWDAIVSCISPSNYTLTYIQPENGFVPADVETAMEGDVVTLSCMPDAGYELTGWVVYDGDNNEIPVANNQFVMPASNVTVYAIVEYILYVEHYELVTSTSGLVNGETYIIVADVDGMKLAMGEQHYTNVGTATNFYRDYVLVELIDDVIAVTPEVSEFTLNKQGNRYTFYDAQEGGYLCTNRSISVTGGRVSYIYSLATQASSSYKYWNVNMSNGGACTVRNSNYSKDMGLGDENFSVFASNENHKVYFYKKVLRASRGGENPVEKVEPVVKMYEETAPIEANSIVYPNPTSGQVTVEARNMKQISVFNAMGQLVYEARESDDKFDIDLSRFVKGMAILRIVTEDGISTQRVIIQ